MGPEMGRLVNFSYCNGKKGEHSIPATVEFRQHQGSLDGNDVFHWARHCIALVSLAQRYAAEGKVWESDMHWDDPVNIEHLWEEMDLSKDTRNFYRQRIDQADADENPFLMFVPAEESSSDLEDLDFEYEELLSKL